MNPASWWVIVLGVLAVLMAASFIYWKVRKSRHAHRHVSGGRNRTGRMTAPVDDTDYMPYRPERVGYRPQGTPYAPPPFEEWQRAGQQPFYGGQQGTVQMNAPYGAPPQQHEAVAAYPPDEIARREAAWRFRPIAPRYEANEWKLSGFCIQMDAEKRELDVLRQFMQELTTYCEIDQPCEARRAVDEAIQDMYFSQTGLDMVSEAVCDLIDGELERGIAAQRLRVRLYNTYLTAAKKSLDNLTVELMKKPVVREHPDYQELVLTAQELPTGGNTAEQNYERPLYDPRIAQPFSMTVEEMYNSRSPIGGDPEERRECERLRKSLGLKPIVMQGDARQMLCAHEDNMQKICRAVEAMETKDTPEPYEIRYLPLLIALRKAYCGSFVLNFDRTIDTMPHDVCEQQLKNLRDALQAIRKAYTQYSTM